MGSPMILSNSGFCVATMKHMFFSTVSCCTSSTLSQTENLKYVYLFYQVVFVEIKVILSSDLLSCSINLISSPFYKTMVFYLIFKQGFKLICSRVGLTQCYIQFNVIIVFFHCENPIYLLYLVQG